MEGWAEHRGAPRATLPQPHGESVKSRDLYALRAGSKQVGEMRKEHVFSLCLSLSLQSSSSKGQNKSGHQEWLQPWLCWKEN